MEKTVVPMKWTEADARLYNVSIGLGSDAADHAYLLHSSSPTGLRAYATLPLGMLHRNAPAVLAPWRVGALGALGRYADFNPAGLVHGDQSIVWSKADGRCTAATIVPASWSGAVTHEVTGVEQKKTGVVIVIRSTFTSTTGEPLCYSGASMFLRGGTLRDEGVALATSLRGNAKKTAPPVSDAMRVQDLAFLSEGDDKAFSRRDFQLAPNQAAIYAINSDDNPLHVDFATARRVKFHAPILHGLCTFGYAARAVISTAADALATPDIVPRVMTLRFARPVFPGSKLRVVMRRVESPSTDAGARGVAFVFTVWAFDVPSTPSATASGTTNSVWWSKPYVACSGGYVEFAAVPTVAAEPKRSKL